MFVFQVPEIKFPGQVGFAGLDGSVTKFIGSFKRDGPKGCLGSHQKTSRNLWEYSGEKGATTI